MIRDALMLDLGRVQRHSMECSRVALELQLRKLVGTMRCPVHGGQAIVTVAPERGEGYSVKVSSCCDRFIEEVRAKVEA